MKWTGFSAVTQRYFNGDSTLNTMPNNYASAKVALFHPYMMQFPTNAYMYMSHDRLLPIENTLLTHVCFYENDISYGRMVYVNFHTFYSLKICVPTIGLNEDRKTTLKRCKINSAINFFGFKLTSKTKPWINVRIECTVF